MIWTNFRHWRVRERKSRLSPEPGVSEPTGRIHLRLSARILRRSQSRVWRYRRVHKIRGTGNRPNRKLEIISLHSIQLQICSPNSECVNTPGSYRCECKEGFRSGTDSRSCVGKPTPSIDQINKFCYANLLKRLTWLDQISTNVPRLRACASTRAPTRGARTNAAVRRVTRWAQTVAPVRTWMNASSSATAADSASVFASMNRVHTLAGVRKVIDWLPIIDLAKVLGHWSNRMKILMKILLKIVIKFIF